MLLLAVPCVLVAAALGMERRGWSHADTSNLTSVQLVLAVEITNIGGTAQRMITEPNNFGDDMKFNINIWKIRLCTQVECPCRDITPLMGFICWLVDSCLT